VGDVVDVDGLTLDMYYGLWGLPSAFEVSWSSVGGPL
jgi:hypothetical protein